MGLKSEDTLDNSDSSEEIPEESPLHNLNFDLTLSYERWTEICPEKVTYSNISSHSEDREYTILKRGTWAHVLNEEIWRKVKSSCTLSFKRAKVYPNNISNRYVDIIGHCTECHAKLSITSDCIPEIDKSVSFKCMIQNIDERLHTGRSKRKLSGHMRAKVSQELCEGRKQPHIWRAAEALKTMDVGDPEPSHLPNLATLRKAKQERNNKELRDSDPIISLQLLKHSVPYNGSIQDIGLDKFFCHYWTPSQLQLYKSQSKKRGSIVSFDATGTVVKKLKRPNGTSGHLFLYQGILSSEGDAAIHSPVVQMLSERHDINAIGNWLSEWLGAGAPVPKEVVSDFSLAILGGLVKAFTPHPDLKSYIN